MTPLFLLGFSFAEDEDSGASDEETEASSDEETSDEAGESDEVEEEISPREKELQSRITKVEQENKKLKEEYELLANQQDWRQFTPKEETETASSSEDEDEIATKRDLSQHQQRINQQLYAREMLSKFRTENPDLQPYEDLVNTFLQTKTNPRKPLDKRLKEAADKTREFLEQEREKGRKKVEEEKKEKQKEEGKASGLSGSAKTSGEKEEKTGESYEDYIKSRREIQTKKAL